MHSFASSIVLEFQFNFKFQAKELMMYEGVDLNSLVTNIPTTGAYLHNLFKTLSPQNRVTKDFCLQCSNLNLKNCLIHGSVGLCVSLLWMQTFMFSELLGKIDLNQNKQSLYSIRVYHRSRSQVHIIVLEIFNMYCILNFCIPSPNFLRSVVRNT